MHDWSSHRESAGGKTYITTGRSRNAGPPEVLATYNIEFPTTDPCHLYTRATPEHSNSLNDSFWLPTDFGDLAPGFIRENDWSRVARLNPAAVALGFLPLAARRRLFAKN